MQLAIVDAVSILTFLKEICMQSKLGVGCAGAVLIHPLLFLLGFGKGALLGHSQPQPMSPTTAYGSFEYGLAGGGNAVEDILIHYVMTLGLALLFVSFFGMGLAFLLARIVTNLKSPRL